MLGSAKLMSFVATTNAAKAREFYGGTLGLEVRFRGSVCRGIRRQRNDAASPNRGGAESAPVYRARLAGFRISRQRSTR